MLFADFPYSKFWFPEFVSSYDWHVTILSVFGNEFNKFNNTRARMLDSIYHMALRSILSVFRNEFNKFNNTRARMLDSIYHNALRSRDQHGESQINIVAKKI